MNLLDAQWIPVERASGKRDWIAPHQITEQNDPPVRLAATRPDFNGALIQFLIGLLQTTTKVDSQVEWEELFEAPPTPEQLKEQFKSVKFAFNLDGDGPRFMQDLKLKYQPKDKSKKKNINAKDASADDGNSGEYYEVSQLFIERAGEDEKIKDNTDHFIKRDGIKCVCYVCAATALLTLQINAPSSGRGYLTSLRGGGPLTTLIISKLTKSLWHDMWLNVDLKSKFFPGNEVPKNIDTRFPWLFDIREIQPAGVTAREFEGEKKTRAPSKKKETSAGKKARKEKQPRVLPLKIDPVHVFWATPRRIRLVFSMSKMGECNVCHRNELLMNQYLTKNYGLNYPSENWQHPLSPYYKNKDVLQPLHPQPCGFGYHHWLGWVLGTPSGKSKREPAKVVKRYLQDIHHDGQFQLWAFGYDMDNMKARCWYESTLPLYDLGFENKRAIEVLQDGIGKLVSAAELVVFFLRMAVQNSWFGKAELRGDLGFVDATFWSYTESSFYHQLEQWVQLAKSGQHTPKDSEVLRNEWSVYLKKSIIDLFGDLVGNSPIVASDPQKIAEAYRQLDDNLRGPKLMEALGFARPVKDTKRKIKKSQQIETGAQAV